MLVKNSAIFAATTILKGALSFILIAVFTRLLNADSYGDYAIIIVIVNFADVFGFLWVRHYLMRHVMDEPKEEERVFLVNSFAIYLFIGAICVLASFALGASGIIENTEQALLYKLLGLVILSEAISNIVILLARLRLKLGFFFMLSVIKPLLALAIGGTLIYSGLGVQGAVWGLLISCVIASILGLIALPDFKKLSPKSINPKTVKAILVFGLPLITALAVQSAIRATDRLLLEGMIGGDITGLYAAGQDIPYKLLTILISAIHLSAYPMVVKALETKGHEACIAQLKVNCVFLAGILLPAATAIAMLAPQLTNIFLGEAFRPFAIKYFPIFAGISAISCVIQYYFVLSFNLSKKTKLIIIPFIIALMINAGVGFYLIPSMAEQGAMWGSFLSYAFLLIVTIILGARTFPLPFPIIDISKVILSTLMMAASLWFANLGIGFIALIIYTILGGGVYALSLLILNPMNLRQYVRKLAKR